MRTFDFIGFFTTVIQLTQGAPLFHSYEINELTGRCRSAVAYFIRIWPFRIAVAIGRWQETGLSEAEMLHRVFSSRQIPLHGEDGEIDPRFRAQVRQQVADRADGPDEEWTILQMLDLDR